MRQFDIVAGAPVLIPALSVSVVVVNGPQYKLSAQTNILRLLKCVFRWDNDSGNFQDVEIYSVFAKLILNPAGAAKNQHIIIPPKCGDAFMNVGFTSDFGIASAGGSINWGFDVEGAEVRGDDIPNLGGIEIAPAGSGLGFSVELKFVFLVNCGDATDDNITPNFSVIADISDYSESLNSR